MLADLNGDDHLDIIVASEQDDSLTHPAGVSRFLISRMPRQLRREDRAERRDSECRETGNTLHGLSGYAIGLAESARLLA